MNLSGHTIATSETPTSGPLPEWVKERLQGAAEAQLERWAERLLEAPTLAEVFVEAGEG